MRDEIGAEALAMLAFLAGLAIGAGTVAFGVWLGT